MFPEGVIKEAAAWLANHQCDVDEAHTRVPLRDRRPVYYARAQAELTRVSLQCDPADPRAKIGMQVLCGRSKDGIPEYAAVTVTPASVFGYMPGDMRPSFVWPPDLAELLRAKWARADEPERAGG